MRKTAKISLPNWAFNIALKIAELRSAHFQNRFRNKKIISFHKNELYIEHIESIMGYLGDIACAIFLNIDPKVVLKEMVYSTDCLTHRDECDVFFNGCSIDVKLEDYDGYQDKVINNTIKKNEPYGCRLINKAQWEQNSKNIDIYVFGAFDYNFSDNFKLHNVKNVNLIGFIEKKDVEKYEFSDTTPAGRKLPTETKIIPNDDLKDINLLKNIQNHNRTFAYNNCNIKKHECIVIINELEKIWNQENIEEIKNKEGKAVDIPEQQKNN
jgi:hypothetical protein